MGAIGERLWFGTIDIGGGYTLHPLVLVFAISGSLMISRIRIPKLLARITPSRWVFPLPDAGK